LLGGGPVAEIDLCAPVKSRRSSHFFEWLGELPSFEQVVGVPTI